MDLEKEEEKMRLELRQEFNFKERELLVRSRAKGRCAGFAPAWSKSRTSMAAPVRNVCFQFKALIPLVLMGKGPNSEETPPI